MHFKTLVRHCRCAFDKHLKIDARIDICVFQHNYLHQRASSSGKAFERLMLVLLLMIVECTADAHSKSTASEDRPLFSQLTITWERTRFDSNSKDLRMYECLLMCGCTVHVLQHFSHASTNCTKRAFCSRVCAIYVSREFDCPLSEYGALMLL